MDLSIKPQANSKQLTEVTYLSTCFISTSVYQRGGAGLLAREWCVAQ